MVRRRALDAKIPGSSPGPPANIEHGSRDREAFGSIPSARAGLYSIRVTEMPSSELGNFCISLTFHENRAKLKIDKCIELILHGCKNGYN